MRFSYVFLLFTLMMAPGASQADPRSHYMIHCMGCHLSDGRGMPPDVPVFNEQLGLIVSTNIGRAYLVRVPGASQSPLSDQALADVINWMLHKYSDATLPVDFEPYSGEEVSRYRSDVLTDPAQLRAKLLLSDS